MGVSQMEDILEVDILDPEALPQGLERGFLETEIHEGGPEPGGPDEKPLEMDVLEKDVVDSASQGSSQL